MAGDVNTFTATGTIVTQPTLVNIKNNKQLLVFRIRCVEEFLRPNGDPAFHENFFTIEVLGKNAYKYVDTLKKGSRYAFYGYLRSDEIDGLERTRARCYQILEHR
jgi:single-stranded DNA-binding protein